MCVSFNRICLSVTLGGLECAAPCHSKFSNQFSKNGTRGGLAAETGLMWRVLVSLLDRRYSILGGPCVSRLMMIAGAGETSHSAWRVL